jgi:hypothetical protein
VLSVHPTARTHSKTPVPHSSVTCSGSFPSVKMPAAFFPPSLVSSRLVALRVSYLFCLLGSFSPLISSNVSRSEVTMIWRERAAGDGGRAGPDRQQRRIPPEEGKTPKHETMKGIRGGDKHQARSASQPSDRAPGRPRFKIRWSLLSFEVMDAKSNLATSTLYYIIS